MHGGNLCDTGNEALLKMSVSPPQFCLFRVSCYWEVGCIEERDKNIPLLLGSTRAWYSWTVFSNEQIFGKTPSHLHRLIRSLSVRNAGHGQSQRDDGCGRCRAKGEGVKALGDVPTLKSYVKQVSYRSLGTRSERDGRDGYCVPALSAAPALTNFIFPGRRILLSSYPNICLSPLRG